MTAAEHYTLQGMKIGNAKGRADGRAEGKAEGEKLKGRAIAITALQKGLAISLIAELTGLKAKVIEQLKTELEQQ